MPEKLILTRADIAKWLGITTDQAKRLPVPTLPVATRGEGKRQHSRVSRDAVIRYLAGDGPDTPPFPVHRKPRRRK